MNSEGNKTYTLIASCNKKKEVFPCKDWGHLMILLCHFCQAIDDTIGFEKIKFEVKLK